MSSSAYALISLFAVVSVLAGLVAWQALRVPTSPAGLILPALGAFGALYLAGHRLGWSIGPTVRLFGFEVALAFDAVLALAAALVVAVLQRLAVSGLRRQGPGVRQA
ncbi:MAG TPA: hypothetical protein VF013_08740 [Candidatus Limnocylindria bacterium]